MSVGGLTLDVGCGPAKEAGAVGIDQFALEGVDVVCNLDKGWPLRSAVCDRVVFRHSINHLRDLRVVLQEAERVTKPGGTVHIIAPHFSSDNIFTDPTVKFFTGYRTMDYYCVNTATRYRYYASTRLELIYRRIHLYKSTPQGRKQEILNKLVFPLEAVINRFPRIYEKFFCFMLRANEVVYVLKVI
ncbi:MAG: methyltransferase domain-containing protein [Gammaproteobacteria bacterium]